VILHAVEMGEGPPLVLLHGLFGAAANFTAVQRRLGNGRRVIALDLRNHGTSPHDPAMPYAAMAADVRETLAALGVAAADVLGHSMGGKVAMALALHDPGTVRRLVVADIAPVRYPPAYRSIADAMLALPISPALTRAEAQAALTPAVPDPAVRGFLLQNLRFGAGAEWRIGLAEIAANLPAIEGWDEAGTPFLGSVLVLRGERSAYVLPEHRPAFRALFPAARFTALRHAGHWLHAEAPDAFVAVVEGFLSSTA